MSASEDLNEIDAFLAVGPPVSGIEELEALQRQVNELRAARLVAAAAVGLLPRLSWWGRRRVGLRVWWRRVRAR